MLHQKKITYRMESSEDDFMSEDEAPHQQVKKTKNAKVKKTSNSKSSKSNNSSTKGLFSSFGFKTTDRESYIEQMTSSSTVEVHSTKKSRSDSDEDDEDVSVYELTPPRHNTRSRKKATTTTSRQSNRNIETRQKRKTVSYADPDSSDDFIDPSEQVSSLLGHIVMCF